MKQKSVSAKLYDEKYYLNECAGYKEYKKGKGDLFDRRLIEFTPFFPKLLNKKVLDVGCGRGEIIFWSAKNKAKKAIGTDYSPSAVKVAKRTLKNVFKNKYKNVDFLTMDATDLKFKENYFDVVFFTEVFEHIFTYQQEMALQAIYRVLKKNGKLFFHTEPNKIFNDVGYKYWSYPVSTLLIYINKILTGKKFINIPHWKNVRTENQKITHVNEASYFHVYKMLRKSGFKGKIQTTNIVWRKPILSWKDWLYNLIVFFDPLSRHFPLNILFGQDFLVIARKK